MYYRYANCFRKPLNTRYCSKAFYSRRSNPNQDKYYKVVGKSGEPSNEGNKVLAPIANWELMTPRGYRFYMPDNVGPAWHDTYTTTRLIPKDFEIENSKLDCYAQECPILLRNGIAEVFPGVDINYTRLTIISLSQKKLKYGMNEMDLETVTKTFVVTAQEICRKLKETGYWADFVNPFSGMPAMNTYVYTTLFNPADFKSKFNVAFRITEKQNCSVIDHKKSQRFYGNIFTSAPSHVTSLRRILLQYEED